eukprot:365339-Chlamydomonas_euryale.AAC.2
MLHTSAVSLHTRVLHTSAAPLCTTRTIQRVQVDRSGCRCACPAARPPLPVDRLEQLAVAIVATAAAVAVAAVAKLSAAWPCRATAAAPAAIPGAVNKRLQVNGALRKQAGGAAEHVGLPACGRAEALVVSLVVVIAIVAAAAATVLLALVPIRAFTAAGEAARAPCYVLVFVCIHLVVVVVVIVRAGLHRDVTVTAKNGAPPRAPM